MMLRPTLRPALRSQALNRTVQAVPRSAGRRFASGGGSAGPKSDLPWIIGSAAVFGPTIFYLTTPSKGHHDGHGHVKEKSYLPSLPLPDDDPESGGKSDDEEGGSSEEEEASDPDAPAGEGRPHGAGDHALRDMQKSDDDPATKQKNTSEPTDMRPNPHKMAAAREGAVSSDSNSTGSTKEFVAEANARRDEEKGQKGQQKEQEAKSDEGDD